MTVYIDDARHRLGRMIMGHMIADNLEELHQMAKAIGMKEAWYQPISFPHYDVSLERRAKALSLNAVQIRTRELVLIKRQISCNPQFQSDVLNYHSIKNLPLPRFLLPIT